MTVGLKLEEESVPRAISEVGPVRGVVYKSEESRDRLIGVFSSGNACCKLMFDAFRFGEVVKQTKELGSYRPHWRAKSLKKHEYSHKIDLVRGEVVRNPRQGAPKGSKTFPKDGPFRTKKNSCTLVDLSVKTQLFYSGVALVFDFRKCVLKQAFRGDGRTNSHWWYGNDPQALKVLIDRGGTVDSSSGKKLALEGDLLIRGNDREDLRARTLEYVKTSRKPNEVLVEQLAESLVGIVINGSELTDQFVDRAKLIQGFIMRELDLDLPIIFYQDDAPDFSKLG